MCPRDCKSVSAKLRVQAAACPQIPLDETLRQTAFLRQSTRCAPSLRHFEIHKAGAVLCQLQEIKDKHLSDARCNRDKRGVGFICRIIPICFGIKSDDGFEMKIPKCGIRFMSIIDEANISKC